VNERKPHGLTCNECGVTGGYLKAGKVWKHTNGNPPALCPSSDMDPALCCITPLAKNPALFVIKDEDAPAVVVDPVIE
jgi:hypothetical protein